MTMLYKEKPNDGHFTHQCCYSTHTKQLQGQLTLEQSGTLHFDATYGWSRKIATFCPSQYLLQAEIDPVHS